MKDTDNARQTWGLPPACVSHCTGSFPFELSRKKIKSLWVKIDLSLLSRIPGQEPFETISVKTEPREANVKHRRPSRESPTPAAEKTSAKSKRKHKVSNFHHSEENTISVHP